MFSRAGGCELTHIKPVSESNISNVISKTKQIVNWTAEFWIRIDKTWRIPEELRKSKRMNSKEISGGMPIEFAADFWKNSWHSFEGIPEIFSGRTAKKFPVELHMNFGGIAGGTPKECIEEFRRNSRKDCGGIPRLTVEDFRRNYGVFYGGSLKESSDKLQRNSWRNPGRISEETTKNSWGITGEIMWKIRENYWWSA